MLSRRKWPRRMTTKKLTVQKENATEILSSLSPLTVSWKCNFSMTPHVRLLAGVFFGRHNLHAACQRNETDEVGTYKREILRKKRKHDQNQDQEQVRNHDLDLAIDQEKETSFKILRLSFINSHLLSSYSVYMVLQK